ncbi:MAG TPA: ABC transporter permease [Anaeromyxobacteraceae bacterium]|nr:ABC transporter permease [Anaeromyxobacteraceae bacterium]
MSLTEERALEKQQGRERRRAGTRTLAERFTALAPLWTLIVLGVVFGVGSGGSFLRAVNLNNILIQSSPLAILATGMTFVLLTGEIDLSIAAVMGLTGMIAARLYLDLQLPEPWPVVLALLCATALGLVSGVVSMRFRIPTFMTTLAMSMIADGLNQWISGGKTIFTLSPLVQDIGSARIGGDDSLLRVMTAIAIGTLLVGFLVLRFTRFGRYVYMSGASKSASRLAGVNVNMVIVACLTICSFLAGVAGVVMVGHLGSALPMSIPSFLIETIAAVVLGGTALTGGRGSMFLTAIGVLIYQTLRNGLDNIAGINNFMKVFITGLVLLVALIVNVVFSGRRERDLT